MSSEQPDKGQTAVLDRTNQALIVSGRRVQLTPKAFAVLDVLHARSGRLVAKDDLLEAVWPRVYVGEAVLKVAVREIRKALSDDPRKPRYIETLHRRGYRFIGELPVSVDEPASVSGEHSDMPLPAPVPAQDAEPVFIGRKTQIERLDQYLELALAGQRQLIFISGEPGIGKTVLIEQWLTQNAYSQGEGGLVARGQCLEQRAGAEAYLPILDALARLCRGAQGLRLKSVLANYAPTWLSQLPWLVDAADVGPLQAELLGSTRERMLREMAEFLEVISADTSVLLILEDLHWSDYATLDLIAYLARRCEPARLMLLTTFRHSDLAQRDHPLIHMPNELLRHGLCQHLELEFFTAAQVQSYLQACRPGISDVKRLAAWLHQRSAGHPLFVFSAVNFLFAQRLLLEKNGGWELALPLTKIEIQVPAQLQQILHHQQERLEQAQRRLLQCAALVGERFSAAAVARLMDRDIVDIEDHCEALVWDGHWLHNADSLEWPDGTLAECYQFASTLHRDFFYAALPAGRRRQYHAKLAFCLEAAYREQTGIIAADLAYHFERGAEPARAIAFLQLACAADQARFAAHEALRHIEKAISLAVQLPEQELNIHYAALLKKRSELLLASGQIERGIASYQELIAWAREAAEAEHLASALLGLASTFFWVDRHRCLQLADEALACAMRQNDALLQAHIGGWHAHWNSLIKGFQPEHISAYDGAVAMARKADDKALECQHLALSAYLHNLRSNYVLAENSARQGLLLAQQLGDGQQYLVCQFFRAWALFYAGRWAEMSDVIQDAMAIADKNSHHPWQVHFQLQLAWLQISAFDSESARITSDPILQRVKTTGLFGSEFFFGLILQARIYLALDALDQVWSSLSEIERRLQKAPDSIDWILRLPLQLTLAEYWHCRGDSSRAQDAAQRLLTLASGPMDRTHFIYAQALLCENALLQQNEALFWQASNAAQAVVQNDDAEIPLAALRFHLANARFHDQVLNKDSARHWLRAKNVLRKLLTSIKDNAGLLAHYQTHPAVVEVLGRTGV